MSTGYRGLRRVQSSRCAGQALWVFVSSFEFRRLSLYGSAMSDQSQDWDRLINGLRSGDERVIHDFYGQYGALMETVADKHLAQGLRRRIGPEDVVQSACRTFLRRAKGGEFQI